MLKINNTLTRKKEDFLPQNPPMITMYTCGVTVYDDCHIGHARSLYIFDLIRRYLKYKGFQVKFVRNITDIDDKIIKRANELKTDWQGLVAKYIEHYYQDIAALGIEKGDFEPKATENIQEIIKFIQGLFDKGFAYKTQSGVYFSVRKFASYGKLSGQSIDQMLEGVRKASDESKEDPLDFALWKTSKEDEPFWDSPWGKGRPGWHIECSVMSTKYLNTETLDIHAGGRDLAFPHHENEIAQSESLTGKPFANYWIHHGLLTINQQKMSKSLGNFITIKAALEKCHPDVLKLIFLQANYSSSMDFSWKKAIEATKAYRGLAISCQEFQEKAIASAKNLNDQVIIQHKERFILSLDDDFNTPGAISELFQLLSYCHKLNDDSKLKFGLETIKEMCSILGLSPQTAILHGTNADLRLSTDESKGLHTAVKEDYIDKMLEKRYLLKKEKLYAEADKIRKEIEGMGIEILDKKDGTTEWRLK
jgi:cysteinyl-tRNA synthetase